MNVSFKYFYSEKVFEGSSISCVCCDENRNLYFGPTSSSQTGFCKSCIHSGEAAEKFNLVFNSVEKLENQNLDQQTVLEITQRTPGFHSNEKWLCHCDDACEFHGDLSKEEALNPDIEGIRYMLIDSHPGTPFNPANDQELMDAWFGCAQHYEVGAPSTYKFVCRHCDKVFYQVNP